MQRIVMGFLGNTFGNFIYQENNNSRENSTTQEEHLFNQLKPIKFIKKDSVNKLPINPLFPLIVSQYVPVWKTVKNNVPVIEYRIIKNKLSIIYKIFLLIIMDRDIKKKEIGISNDIKPID